MLFYKSSTTKNKSAGIADFGIFGRALIALSLLCGLAARANDVCYVNGGATGKNDGSSWTDAYTNPQFALLNSACSEIWVARGVYKPTLGTDQSVAFEIGPGVAMYGGFTGGEMSRDVRDPTRYVTVLSGDVDNNDANALTTGIDVTSNDIRGSNSFHVIAFPGQILSPITSTTVLNGFTITGGDASGLGGAGVGGGALCYGGEEGNECSPSLGLDIFSGNRALVAGGALYGNGQGGGNSSPSLTDVIFVGNSAAQGGAMFTTSSTDASDTQGTSAPVLLNVTFDSNIASLAGGGMYNDASGDGVLSPKLEKVTFKNNSVSGAGHPGGAVYSLAVGAVVSPEFKNVTFFGNAASFGGAVVNDSRSSGNVSAQALNITFEANVADNGGAIYNVGGSTFRLRNVILWNDQSNSDHAHDEIYDDGSSLAIDYGVVSNNCPVITSVACTVVYTDDPKLGPLVNNGGFTDTLLPARGSAAIDKGDDTICPGDDQRGVARPQGSHCDIGAVEVQALPPPTAQPINVTTPRDTPVAIVFIGNDSNPGGPFSFTTASLPTHGTLGAVSGNTVIYTPTLNYSGPDFFKYTATDMNGTSVPAPVNITVLPIGGGPPPPKTVAIPTLSTWSLLTLAGLLGLTCVWRKRNS